MPLSWARGPSSSATPCTSASISKGSSARSIRPASILEKSRISSISDMKAAAELRKPWT